MRTSLQLVNRCVLAAVVIAVASVLLGAGTADAQAGDLVAPELDCVTVNGDGTYTALFGTSNLSDEPLFFPHGSKNHLTPGNLEADLPEWIPPGREGGVFSVTQDIGKPINYKLGTTTVHATSNSVACSSAPQVAEAPFVVGLLAVAGAVSIAGYRRLRVEPTDTRPAS